MKPVFARVLNSLRRESGLSQKKAADDLGISQALLSHYENGVREPKLEFILKACDYYGVSTDYLLGRTDKKQMDLNMVLNSENADIQRCVNAGSLILAMLSEIKDEQVNVAAAKYLSYSLYFVINALRVPVRPYEPLFDAAKKTAEADLIKTAEWLGEKAEDGSQGLSDEAIKDKYPELYQTIRELDGLIENTITGIRKLIQPNLY